MRTTSLTIIIALTIGTAVLVYSFFSASNPQTLVAQLHQDLARDIPLKEINRIYREALSRHGAIAAQDALSRALPESPRAHVIQHEAGKFLYDTEGTSGILECRPFFGGGCYHGFVESILYEDGFSEVMALTAECEQYLQHEQIVQCAHGVGHAVLIAADYRDLPKALETCATIFNNDTKRRINCYDGIFMENNFGAFTRPPEDRWYKESDPMFPCKEPFVLKHHGAKEVCWGLQAQLTLGKEVYPVFNAEIARVERFCDTLSDEDERFVCLEGIARQIQIAHAGDVSGIVAECGALSASRRPLCIAQAYETSYIYGNRSPEILAICTTFEEQYKKDCYITLYAGIATSFSSTEKRLEVCATLPEERFAQYCSRWMQSSAASVF